MTYPPNPLLLFIARSAGQEIDEGFMKLLRERKEAREEEHDLSV